MTEEDEGYMIDDDETIEIAYFTFNKIGATYWDSESDFRVIYGNSLDETKRDRKIKLSHLFRRFIYATDAQIQV